MKSKRKILWSLKWIRIPNVWSHSKDIWAQKWVRSSLYSILKVYIFLDYTPDNCK